MTYLNNLAVASNRQARTENGAVTLQSTGSALLDFFALAGGTRHTPDLGLDLFKKAFAEDRQKAIRILFYLRDIRGGQGERNLFRNALAYLAANEPEVAENIKNYVPEYGRWDDLLALGVKNVVRMIVDQLEADRVSDNPSLLAKWMPSENTSSKQTRALARQVREELGMTPKAYRQMLSFLRKKIALLETKITQKEYAAIEYDKIPSQAGLKYRKAFSRNDGDRYAAFLGAVDKGEKKINTATLYPYQVYQAAGTPGAEQLWANLPDYTQGKNALVVADVSGSMSGEPMSVSVSLALYFAERNEGIFKDHFVTFSENPRLQKVQGKTLRDRMNSIQNAEWGGSTNVNGVFKLLIDTAVASNANPEEMPETIYIISDMEFNWCGEQYTNFELIDKMYAGTKYKRPNLVFWNVAARSAHVPVDQNTPNITLVSGLSASTFKLAVENKSPIELMEETINSERYANIVI